MTDTLNFSQIAINSGPASITDLMGKALANSNLLSLAAGFTANEILPTSLVENAWYALHQSTKTSKNHEYLQYGTTQGRPILRKEIAKLLANQEASYGTSFDAEKIIITNGSQQALYLTMQTLCDPGDIVLVQNPSYFVFLELLKGLGIEAMPIPNNEHDQIDIASLEQKLISLKQQNKAHRIKAVYLVSYYANPSSKSLSIDQKRNLGVLLKKLSLQPAIMEDAAYRELFFENAWPAPSIHTIPELQNHTKIYYGTFSKSFSSGLKVGFAYVENNSNLFNKILNIKAHHDFGSCNFSQALIEKTLLDNAYLPYLQTQRAYYHKKAQILSEALIKEGAKEIGCSWEDPQGGLFIWLKGPENLDFSPIGPLFEKAVQNGVLYVPGTLCFASTDNCTIPKNYMRLSFGTLPEKELALAAKRLVKTMQESL